MKRTRKPSFRWQGVLILAPVAVLACIGFVAARNDRVAVRRDAEQQARDLAQRAAVGVWEALCNSNAAALRIEVDHRLRLIHPAPYPPNPVPQLLDLSFLSPEQRTLWATFQSEQDTSVLAQNVNNFLVTRPPLVYQSAAHLLLGRRMLHDGSSIAAISHFSAATNVPAEALAESGLPLIVLAHIHLLTAQLQTATLSQSQQQAATAELIQLAIAHPSVLTPELLRRAADDRSLTPALRRRLEEKWFDDETARQIHRTLQSTSAPALISARSTPAFEAADPTIVWVEWTNDVQAPEQMAAAPNTWCVVRVPHTNGATMLARNPDEVRTALRDTLSHLKPPPFLGFSLSVGRVRIIDSVSVDDSEITTPALATFTQVAGGQPAVLANVHLVSPDLLYARQNQRVIWLALVVGAAALTAVAGFVAAYRAFARQLRLVEMQSNFVSSVSHELRAPIASMRLMAEALQRGTVADPVKQRDYFRFLVQECRRLSGMIENVLDFARIEQSRKDYVLEPTNVHAVLEQTVTLMQSYAAERGVALRLQHDYSRECTAMADGHAIQQALVNLIDNAIKHSTPGQEVSLQLNIDPSRNGEHNGLIRIAVADRGPGVPPAEQQKIFDRFYRLGSELRRETAGVGIGLSIARHIMQGHGGDIRVQSEPGHGSTFTLEWPCGNDNVKEDFSENTKR